MEEAKQFSGEPLEEEKTEEEQKVEEKAAEEEKKEENSNEGVSKEHLQDIKPTKEQTPDKKFIDTKHPKPQASWVKKDQEEHTIGDD